jgi:hypothetical protein
MQILPSAPDSRPPGKALAAPTHTPQDFLDPTIVQSPLPHVEPKPVTDYAFRPLPAPALPPRPPGTH